ncbi:unnamed protein product [Trifolium pratense]|uniref:Uncharacterized protein n=1 Tax=Trifolium pratense TaxID=57577 RepID=A0ACB0L0R8_TRIPR|nr:unnamed protein product [Trifolium pratense]
MGRGRGRTRKSVPPSPARSPTPLIPTQQDATAVSNTNDGSSSVPIEKVEDEGFCSKASSIAPKDLNDPADCKQQDGTKKLWVDVLSGNRNPANGLAMEYVAPTRVNGEVEVEIDAADIASEVKFWETSLIMYVLGGDLSMTAVKQFMTKFWNFAKLPDMFYNEEGYFILRFHSFQDKDDVLMKGPYTIRNMPMILRDWKPDFSLKRDMLRTLPIWVKLPQLPLHLWGVRSLSKIGSAIGNPIVTDECTANKFRVSYARILVEMDVTQELPTDITIKDSAGNKMKQVVEYEWKPLFCDKCQKMGHRCAKDPPPRMEKQWKPKPPEAQPVEQTPLLTDEHMTGKEADTWTEIHRNGKVKGKGTQGDNSHTQVMCSNGFETLGTLNGPLVFQDTGQ